MIHIFRFIVNAIALYCIARWVPGFNHAAVLAHPFAMPLYVALIFGVVNALIGPILKLVSWPVNFLTHGLFGVVINYLLFLITYQVTPLHDAASGVSPWMASLYGAVAMMIVGTIVQQLWKHPSERGAAPATA
jgi:putative membrane protein